MGKNDLATFSISLLIYSSKFYNPNDIPLKKVNMLEKQNIHLVNN